MEVKMALRFWTVQVHYNCQISAACYKGNIYKWYSHGTSGIY